MRDDVNTAVVATGVPATSYTRYSPGYPFWIKPVSWRSFMVSSYGTGDILIE